MTDGISKRRRSQKRIERGNEISAVLKESSELLSFTDILRKTNDDHFKKTVKLIIRQIN